MKFNKEVVEFNLDEIKILGNTQNGSFVGLTESGIDLVKKIKENKTITNDMLTENEELIDYLKEYSFFDYIQRENLSVSYLHLTNNCPLHCIGCYSDDDSRNIKKDMTTENIFHEIDELIKNGVETIIISGGEPLIRRDIIDIVKYAKINKKIPQLVLLTSGMIFYPKLSNELAKYVDILSISIDGFSEEYPTFLRDEGIFSRIIRSIKIAKNSNFKKLSVLPTLHNKNIEYIPEYISFSKKYEVDLSFSILTVPSSDILASWILDKNQLTYLGKNSSHIGEDLNILTNELTLADFEISMCKKCGIGEEILSIGADGDVYPCHMAHYPELVLGNIMDEPLEQIKMRAKGIYSKINIDVSNSESCKNCDFKYMCGGGCRARAYITTGDLNGKDPYCPMFKSFFESFKEQIEREVKL